MKYLNLSGGAARCALLAVAFAAAAPDGCLADEGDGATSPAPSAPVGPTAPAPRPMLLGTPAVPILSLNGQATTLGMSVSTPSLRDSVGRSRTERMSRAFATELQDEGLRNRRFGLYANIPEQFPQLLEDSYIERRQAELAESVIGRAVEAALSEGFFGNRKTESRMSVRPMFAVAEHGIKVDASPAWSYRVTGPHGGVRVDIPLTPSSIRLHAFRDLKGTDRTPLRMGAGLVIDPFDEEIRMGISFQF